MTELPRGTVTLLFTDIEGSTRLLQELGREAYVRALTEHRRLLREAFTAHGGVEAEMQGDSSHFAFPFARDAVAAAVAAQRALQEHQWESQPIKVRVGLHTGEPTQYDGQYAGLDVHRAARLMSVGHGGQVLLSERTADIVEGELEDGLAVRLAGHHRLKDLSRPVKIYQLLAEGLRSDFPPLQSLEEVLDSGQRGSRSISRSPWRISRRRVRAITTVALVGAAALGALLFRPASARAPAVLANSAVAIDPATNRVTDVVPVGTTPTAVAGATATVWLINADDQTVTKVNAQSMRVERTVAVGLTPTGLAVGAGSVWVSDGNGRQVARIDAASSLVVRRVELPKLGLGNPGQAVEQIAAGEGSLWIANRDRTVLRIDTRTERIVATIRPRDVGPVAVGEGAVWVAGFGAVFRVDPVGNAVTDEVTLPKSDTGTTALAAGEGSVWVTSPKNDLVWQINAKTLEVTRSINVGRFPSAIAIGAGSVWVANTIGGSVSRIEPASGRVVATVSLGRPVQGIAVVDGRVWVTVG